MLPVVLPCIKVSNKFPADTVDVTVVPDGAMVEYPCLPLSPTLGACVVAAEKLRIRIDGFTAWIVCHPGRVSGFTCLGFGPASAPGPFDRPHPS